MTTPTGQTVKQYYRVDRRDISFLRFVLEGYEGLAVLTTIDAVSGRVALAVAPGSETDVATIVRGLKHDILIEPDQSPKVDDDEILLY